MLELAVGTNWLGPNEGSPLKNQTLMSFNAATGVNFHAIKEAEFFSGLRHQQKKLKSKKGTSFNTFNFRNPSKQERIVKSPA